MNQNKALLALEDGSVFYGKGIGVKGAINGELIFNTSMTGYQEVLTDPSYTNQVIMFTYPHIGNTGTNKEDKESESVWASGLVIRDLPLITSSWRNEMSLQSYLETNEIVAISDVDTRQLTKILRKKGAQSCSIFSDIDISDKEAIQFAKEFKGMSGKDLAKEVTTSSVYSFENDSLDITLNDYKYKVVAYDFGVKKNILRILSAKGCEVIVVPASTSHEEVLSMSPDGVFLSNGPGDPEPCTYAIESIKSLIKSKIPIFGICLGHQLLGLALGAKTKKMKFGHHGSNHPVQELSSGIVSITSQNHGFTLDDSSLPKEVKVTHRSLFDGSIQGIEYQNSPAFSFQGHPEACPGPKDLNGLFEKFIQEMEIRNA